MDLYKALYRDFSQVRPPVSVMFLYKSAGAASARLSSAVARIYILQVFAGNIREPVNEPHFGCVPVSHVESREESRDVQRDLRAGRFALSVSQARDP